MGGGGGVFETIVRKKVYILLFAFHFQQFSTMKKCINKEIFQRQEERNDKQKTILPTKLKEFSI